MATENELGSVVGLDQCDDLMQFENALRSARAIDDKIINALNKAIPTTSFAEGGVKCKQLWDKIDSTYERRESAINRCINATEKRIVSLQADADVSRSTLRQTKTMLRVLSNEIDVEKVIRGRTQKAFHEKCRDFYKPTNNSASS